MRFAKVAPWALALGLVVLSGCASQERQIVALQKENAALKAERQMLNVRLAAATRLGERACAQIETLRNETERYVTGLGVAREHEAAVQHTRQLMQAKLTSMFKNPPAQNASTGSRKGAAPAAPAAPSRAHPASRAERI
jgi:hypothetical protein